MFALGALYADQALRLAEGRVAELHREAAAFRLARTGHAPRKRFGRLASLISSARETLTIVAGDFSPALPSLEGYPYRS
jgi:hypothetical protein